MTSAAKAANQNKALNAALEALRHPKPVQNRVFQQPARRLNPLMIRRITLYSFYLRVAMYGLPALAFGISLLVWIANGRFEAISSSYSSYLDILFILQLVWIGAANNFKLTDVEFLLQERFALGQVLLSCGVSYSCLRRCFSCSIVRPSRGCSFCSAPPCWRCSPSERACKFAFH